jgi:hypothetical protein
VEVGWVHARIDVPWPLTGAIAGFVGWGTTGYRLGNACHRPCCVPDRARLHDPGGRHGASRHAITRRPWTCWPAVTSTAGGSSHIDSSLRNSERASSWPCRAGFGPDGDGHYAYINTEKAIGTTIELIERPKRREPPERTYPPEAGVCPPLPQRRIPLRIVVLSNRRPVRA